MRRIPLAIISTFSFALVFASIRAQEPQQPRPIFRSDAHFVTVDAYPIRNGKVVEGLTAADFTVEEDGQPQAIENFEFIAGAEGTPESARRDPNTVRESQLLAADARTRAFVVYLDIPHVSVEGARASKGPLVTMLNGLIGPNDLLAVTTSEQPVAALTFGRKLVSAEDALTRQWAWGTRGSTRRTPHESEIDQCFPADNLGQQGWIRDGSIMRPVADVLIDRAREVQTLRHLDDLVSYLGQLREGRTSVVLFTEGWRLFSDDGGLTGYTGRQRPPTCDQHLNQYGNLNLQSQLREIIGRANHSNVTFYPVNPTGLVTFDIPISQRQLASGSMSKSGLRQSTDNLNDRVSSMLNLASNTDGLAVVNTNDLKAGLQRVTDQLKWYYLLGYYSTNRKFDGKARRISVEVTQPGIDVKARRGYTAPTEAERTARANPVKAAGPSVVELALDLLSGLRSADDRTFNVSRYLRADAAPLLGVPALFRATPSPRSPLVPVTAPAFTRNERIRIEWPVTQPLTERVARILGRKSTALAVAVTLTERDGPAGPLIVADASLGALAQGDYVIELRVTGPAGTRTSLVPFRVVP